MEEVDEGEQTLNRGGRLNETRCPATVTVPAKGTVPAKRRGLGARPTFRWASALVMTTLVAAGCSQSDGSDSESGASDSPTSATTEPATEKASYTTPGATWDRGDAEDAGFDQAKLDALAKDAEAAGSTCMFVTQDGKLVADYYFNGAGEHDAQEVWSATKSVSSTLVGIAQSEGLLSIEDPAYEFIPEWSTGDAAKVTVKDLLSNDSGRHYDFETDYQKMAVQAADKNQFSIDLPKDAAPGVEWFYNNSAIQTLSEVLEKTVPVDPVDYAAEKLLKPIGMADSEMTRDSTGSVLTFMGLHSTCPDMARFGMLFLNSGKWGDTQVVPEEWVKEATTPSQN